MNIKFPIYAYVLSFEKSSDMNRCAYPSTNGVSCNCSDTYGGTCLAVCSSNIKKYNVLVSSGTGIVNVTCPGGTYALGCGNKPTSTLIEVFPTILVTNENTCSCYHYFGVTCFAICGN